MQIPFEFRGKFKEEKKKKTMQSQIWLLESGILFCTTI